MPLEQYANNVQTTLSGNGGSITSGATSLIVASAAGMPSTGNFRLGIGNEIIIVGARSGTTLSSLTRGAEGTTAASHNDGDVVTVELTAGGLKALQANFVGARVFNSGNVSATNATWTPITMDSERFDTDGFHSTSSATERITIPTGYDGYYEFIGHFDFAGNAIGVRYGRLLLNGATEIAGNNTPNLGAGDSAKITLHTIYHLVAGDYIEMQAYQTSTGNLNVLNGANYSPELMCRFLGP